jgi:hypothetical protein
MKQFFLVCTLILLCLNHGAANRPADESWNLTDAYTNSTHIFYGTLEKSIPESRYRTGITGVNVQQGIGTELNIEEIIWPSAKELTLTVGKRYKGESPATIQVMVPDPDPAVWRHLQNDMGEVFLAQPPEPDPLLANLSPSDEGLFFVRNYMGSPIPVVYKVRFGQRALDDIAILDAFNKAAGTVSLATIQQQAHIAQAKALEREAAAFDTFEDEYYKILRMQDLDIRASLLKDLVARLGYEGRWNYFDYKERMLKLHGPYLEKGAAIPDPTEGKEKLWHDISGELTKIDVILKARGRR